MVLVCEVVERYGKTVGRVETDYGISQPVSSRHYLQRRDIIAMYLMLLGISRHCERQNTCQYFYLLHIIQIDSKRCAIALSYDTPL